jgi:hypothetical protein
MADILIDNQSVPTTPAAGKSIFYVDSTTKRPIVVDDGGGLRGTFLSGNDSTASQTLGTANTYVTNSGILIPSMGMKAGMLFRWLIFYTKTAASTATVAYTVVIGPNQTTADTVRGTLTSVAQTAAVDGGLFMFNFHVRSVSATGATAFNYGIAGKVAANAVGFGSSALDVVPATFDNSALAGQYVGLCINPGAASAWTSTMVECKLTG